MLRTFTALVLLSVATLADEPQRPYSEVPAIRDGKVVLWHDPGAVEQKDLQYCSGGPETAPKPPFTFIKEDTGGTNPKVLVRDDAGRQWAIKFGEEASPDSFASALVCAVGYYVEPSYYVA